MTPRERSVGMTIRRSDLALRFALARSIARRNRKEKSSRTPLPSAAIFDRDYAMALVALRPGISDREMAEAVYGPGATSRMVTPVCRGLTEEKAIARRVRADGLFGNFLRED